MALCQTQKTINQQKSLEDVHLLEPSINYMFNDPTKPTETRNENPSAFWAPIPVLDTKTQTSQLQVVTHLFFLVPEKKTSFMRAITPPKMLLHPLQAAFLGRKFKKGIPFIVQVACFEGYGYNIYIYIYLHNIST